MFSWSVRRPRELIFYIWCDKNIINNRLAAYEIFVERFSANDELVRQNVVCFLVGYLFFLPVHSPNFLPPFKGF